MPESHEADRPFNVYLDFAQPLSLDSMEGVPSVAPVAPALPGEKSLAFDWQRQLHRLFDWIGSMAPGVVLAVLLAYVGSETASYIGINLLGFQKSPLSPILITVMLGLLVRNVIGLPRSYEQGLRLCVKRILRVGVALLGLRLSITAVGTIGLTALPIVIGCIVAALLVVTRLSRLVGLSPRLGSLIAVGTSICGVSAIVATAPVIQADEEEVSYSVAVITLFGMTALFAYPFLAHWLFDGNAELAGFFLGTAIHDTAQVAGAGLMYDLQYDAPKALEVATTTKLVRNVGMGIVIPLMALSYHRQRQQQAATNVVTSSIKQSHWLKWSQMVPLFMLGFVALAILRSVGDLGNDRPFGLIDHSTWTHWLATGKSMAVFFLTISMAAVGLGTSFTQLKNLGWKPLCLGLTAAVLVGCVSVALIWILKTPG
ncbi:MAG: putative sulfate exporter family transporter [Planctomycetaceae bacterium]